MDASMDTIRSDAYQIRQVLVNLLTNAVHAVGSEGSIQILLEDLGDQLALTVRDSGEGIPRENLKKIFESTKPPKS